MWFFISRNPRKSIAAIFLNCTKNTELTRGGFALTFSFALTKKKAQRPSRESRFEDTQHNDLPVFLGSAQP